MHELLHWSYLEVHSIITEYSESFLDTLFSQFSAVCMRNITPYDMYAGDADVLQCVVVIGTEQFDVQDFLVKMMYDELPLGEPRVFNRMSDAHLLMQLCNPTTVARDYARWSRHGVASAA